MINIKDKNFDMDRAVAMIMDIINQEPKTKTISETVYDGQGHVLSVDGVKVTKGKSAKRVKRTSSTKDLVKKDLDDAVEVALNRVAAFEGKVLRNVKDGVIVRMNDADYAIKTTGHAVCEFDVNEEGFKAEMNFITRGKAVNHSSSIAKAIVAEIQNQKSDCSFSSFENEKSISICLAKASGIRIQISNSEFTIKISKKRSRCVA